jgi:ribosomal protein L36
MYASYQAEPIALIADWLVEALIRPSSRRRMWKRWSVPSRHRVCSIVARPGRLLRRTH